MLIDKFSLLTFNNRGQMEDNYKPWDMEENTFLMLMHLSLLAGFIIPLAGIALPIVMWATNKDHSAKIDQHGKVIFNWMISSLIYFVISLILMFVIIGFFSLIALIIVNFVFIIIGAVKANNNGELWPYPLSIQFFKVSVVVEDNLLER